MSCSTPSLECKGNWWQRRRICAEHCTKCSRLFCEECLYDENCWPYCHTCLVQNTHNPEILMKVIKKKIEVKRSEKKVIKVQVVEEKAIKEKTINEKTTNATATRETKINEKDTNATTTIDTQKEEYRETLKEQLQKKTISELKTMLTKAGINVDNIKEKSELIDQAKQIMQNKKRFSQ